MAKQYDYDLMTSQDAQDIARAIRGLAVNSALKYDSSTRRYDNASIKAWLGGMADGKAYGVIVPSTATTICTKIGANAEMANPTPGHIGQPAVDPYAGVGPFLYFYVNGGVDADGVPYVTAIEGDGRFTRTGADVFTLTPVIWWSHSSTDSAFTFSLSDTKLNGMEAEPKAYLPNGDIRPYMLHAAYWSGENDDGKLVSRSGLKAAPFDISHNSMITKASTATTGYSGFSYADYWYLQVMFLAKYATKNSQSVFTGCTNYNYQYAPSVATTGKDYVVLTNANAGSLVIGSTLSIGHNFKSDGTTGTKDRGQAYAKDVIDRARIVNIAKYDDDNMAVVLDADTPFDCVATDLVSTMPWHTGCCDAVEGDGSPIDPKSGKNPFKLQGIELMGGSYEVIADVIFDFDGTNPAKIYVNQDTKNEKTALDTAVYTDTGLALPRGDGSYALGLGYSKGFLGPVVGTSGSTSSGMCDCKLGADTQTGNREFRAFGSLGIGANAGLWYVGSGYGLSDSWWYVGSRLSAVGRGE